MARIDGVSAKNATLLTRILYFVTRRKLGRVVKPIMIKAHHPRLLRAFAHMELGQQAARTMDPQLKILAQVKAAMMIGCPF